tara:strand:+ start:1127 stop:1978 length:852 start_codon:yes stop_codon:yes gene_type:complete
MVKIENPQFVYSGSGLPVTVDTTDESGIGGKSMPAKLIAGVHTGLKPRAHYFRHLIYQYENSDYSAGFFREYTKAFLQEFNKLTFLNGEGEEVDVKTVYGAPERAVGKRNESGTLVLPVGALMIDALKPSEERQKYEPLINFETYFDSDAQRYQRIVSFAPKPVVLSYTVSFYAKYMEDINQLSEKLELMFNPSLKIPVDFDSHAQSFITDRQEATSVVVGDREDRVLKRSFSISIQSYIPAQKYLVTSTGKIEALKMEATLRRDSTPSTGYLEEPPVPGKDT